MNALIDPRPLEPDWVSEAPPVDLVTWRATYTHWDAQSRSTNHTISNGSGDSYEFLEFIAKLLKTGRFCHTIHVNASQSGGVDSSLLATLDYPSGINSAAWWSVSNVLESTEEGLDADELFDWLVYQLSGNKCFTLNLSDYDPTP